MNLGAFRAICRFLSVSTFLSSFCRHGAYRATWLPGRFAGICGVNLRGENEQTWVIFPGHGIIDICPADQSRDIFRPALLILFCCSQFPENSSAIFSSSVGDDYCHGNPGHIKRLAGRFRPYRVRLNSQTSQIRCMVRPEGASVGPGCHRASGIGFHDRTRSVAPALSTDIRGD